MLQFLFHIALTVFLMLFGIFAVTNLEVTWGEPIMGFSALLAGILGIMVVFQNPYAWNRP